MQKGKMSRSGLVASARAITGVLLLLNAAWGRTAKAADAWERGMGGLSFPARTHPVTGRREGGFLLVVLSAENPYSIPGLYRSSASLSVVRRSWSSGLEWDRTVLGGYSRDFLAATAGVATPGRIVHLTVVAETEREAVDGCGSETVLRIRLAASLDLAGLIYIELERPALSSGDIGGQRGGPCARIFVRGGGGSVSAGLIVREYAYPGRIIGAGASVSIAGPISLMAGYRFDTGEVTGGISAEAAAAVALSWGCHPDLGCTFAVSVGAVR